MKDVTELVMQYRQVLLNVWNTHVWANPQLRDIEIMHAFERLRKPLFKFFVWDTLAPETPMAKQVFGPCFKAIPLEGCKLRSILIDTPWKWNEINGEFDPRGLELHVTDLFEWQQNYWRDYRKFEARIDCFTSRPELIGKQVLVDVFEVAIFFNEALCQQPPK